MKTVGRFARAAPMSIPGTILSQFGMQIIASKQCAAIIVSTASAISSREGSEYRIPSCPIAIPSSTAIVLNSNGMPPACLTASFTTRANACRCTCPGTMSQYELQTAMNGLSKSRASRICPVARSRLRCGAREFPFLITSDRIPAFMTVPVAWKTKKPLPCRKRLWCFASPLLVGEAERHFSTLCPLPRSHADKPHDKEGNKDEANEDEREIHSSIRLNSEYC